MMAVDQCVEHLIKKNFKLWIFPEGTRNHENSLLPFKKGAFNIAVKLSLDDVCDLTERIRDQMSPVYESISQDAKERIENKRPKQL
uniref:1-acylglycerol-3-phosphate O-acyltransferase n=1 Tax=Heterorhabditis bacteriophora TaxID=37862 RepID=A0A1I7XLL7_HETBA